MSKLTKGKAIAILLYDTMKLGVRKPTEYFMRVLEINQHELYTPIKYLCGMGLVRTYDGNTSGGIERIKDESLELICFNMRVQFKDSDSLINECEEIVDATRRLHSCDVCDELVPYLNKSSMCVDCATLTAPDPIKRLAKCGHLSLTRYFKCENCEPTLPEEDFEYEVGTTQSVSSSD